MSNGWCWDYPDASTVIRVNFDGRLITPSGNINFSEVNDPTLNELIDRANDSQGGQRARLWAEANDRVMELAPVVPWRWEAASTVVSKRVGGFQFTLASSTIDLAAVWLKSKT